MWRVKSEEERKWEGWRGENLQISQIIYRMQTCSNLMTGLYPRDLNLLTFRPWNTLIMSRLTDVQKCTAVCSRLPTHSQKQAGLFGQYSTEWPQPKTIPVMLLVGGEHATKLASTYTESLGLWIDSRFLLYIGNVWSDTLRGLRLTLS